MPFDRDYYQRFYFNPRTAVTSRPEMRARARLIVGCVEYLGLPVGSILDAGCGVGLLRTAVLRSFKGADYTGVGRRESLVALWPPRAGARIAIRPERTEFPDCAVRRGIDAR